MVGGVAYVYLNIESVRESVGFCESNLKCGASYGRGGPPMYFFSAPKAGFRLFPLRRLTGSVSRGGPPGKGKFSKVALTCGIRRGRSISDMVRLMQGINKGVMGRPRSAF